MLVRSDVGATARFSILSFLSSGAHGVYGTAGALTFSDPAAVFDTAIQADGSALVLYSDIDPGSGDRTLRLSRYLPSGIVDQQFATAGVLDLTSAAPELYLDSQGLGLGLVLDPYSNRLVVFGVRTGVGLELVRVWL